MNEIDEYKKKVKDFIIKDLKLVSSPKIVEFGVRRGISTKMFIDICKKNNGFLQSIDIRESENFSDSRYWKFHLTRDDNFDYLDQVIPDGIDLFYLDSFHDANHIEKIIYHYYPKLNLNGQFIIDDVSWIPYLKDEKRNSFNCERNNNETYERIMEINYGNSKNQELYFSFVGSGLAKIIKRSNDDLFALKKIKTRKFSIKNFFRKILKIIIN
jgi:predicted O-methyltransferase YrrM